MMATYTSRDHPVSDSEDQSYIDGSESTDTERLGATRDQHRAKTDQSEKTGSGLEKRRIKGHSCRQGKIPQP